MKQLNVLIILVSCWLGFSCTEPQKIHEDQQLISQMVTGELDGTSYALVIPMDGCGGCRSIAINYLQDTEHPKPTMHYIASSRHPKTAKIKLGDSFVSQNVILDAEEIFYQTESSEKYPLLYRLENGIITNKKKLDPSNVQEALYTLE